MTGNFKELLIFSSAWSLSGGSRRLRTHPTGAEALVESAQSNQLTSPSLTLPGGRNWPWRSIWKLRHLSKWFASHG